MTSEFDQFEKIDNIETYFQIWHIYVLYITVNNDFLEKFSLSSMIFWPTGYKEHIFLQTKRHFANICSNAGTLLQIVNKMKKKKSSKHFCCFCKSTKAWLHNGIKDSYTIDTVKLLLWVTLYHTCFRLFLLWETDHA